MRLCWAVVATAMLGGVARAAPALEAYGRLPAVEEMRLSPSGNQLAMVAVVGEARRVLAMSLDGKPRLAVPVGSLKVRSLTWAGEDHLLVKVSQLVNLPFVFATRYELGTDINLDLEAKASTVVFSKNADVYPAIMGDYGVRDIGGGWFGYFGAITLARSQGESHLEHTFPDLYRVDLQSGVARRVIQGGELAHAWVIAADGAVVARSEYDRKSGDWRLVTGDFGGRRLLTRKAPLDEIGVAGLGRTADTVLISDATGEPAVIEEQPLAGEAPTRLFEHDEVRRFLHAGGSRLLIGAEVEGPRGAVLFDPRLQARVDGARKALPGYHVSLVSYTDDFNRMVVFTDGGDDSGTYWLVDIPTHDAKPVGAAYPAIPAKEVGPTRRVEYTAADGMALDGVLTLPPGREAKNLPVVVMPHGGPIGPYDEVGFDWWAQAFASRGYAVFQPNYRGSGGHGDAYRRAGYGQWGRKMQSDISDGLAEIVRQGLVDPRRACIVGASYGGYAALAGVTLQHGLYRCAVSYAGVADLQDLLSDTALRTGGDNNNSRFDRAAIGVKDRGDPLIGALSPVGAAAKADAPILLIHGKDDTVVAPAQTAKMAAALRRAGKPVEVDMLDGEDHWLSREKTRIETLKASVAFVETHNPAN